MDFFDANDAILVLSPYMLIHTILFLRGKIAVRAHESRRLAAFVCLMSRQAGLVFIHARTFRAGKSRASVRFSRFSAIRFSLLDVRNQSGCTET